MIGDDAWFDERWESLSPEQRKFMADTIRDALDEENVEWIKERYAKYGREWIHHFYDIAEEQQETWHKVGMIVEGQTTYSGHMWWGMGIRNLLREAGVKDEDLPFAPYEIGQFQNLDDYYIQAVEAAVGLRDA